MTHDVDTQEMTEEASLRWNLLATILSLGIGLSMPLFIMLHTVGHVDLTTIPQGWYVPYALGWMMVMVYALGEQTFRAVREGWYDK